MRVGTVKINPLKIYVSGLVSRGVHYSVSARSLRIASKNNNIYLRVCRSNIKIGLCSKSKSVFLLSYFYYSACILYIYIYMLYKGNGPKTTMRRLYGICNRSKYTWFSNDIIQDQYNHIIIHLNRYFTYGKFENEYVSNMNSCHEMKMHKNIFIKYFRTLR